MNHQRIVTPLCPPLQPRMPGHIVLAPAEYVGAHVAVEYLSALAGDAQAQAQLCQLVAAVLESRGDTICDIYPRDCQQALLLVAQVSYTFDPHTIEITTQVVASYMLVLDSFLAC